jgi:hypothetical protein
MSTVLLQIAVLPGDLLGPDGQPNLQGWGHLKHGRKKFMFMGIMGSPLLPGNFLPVLLPTWWPLGPHFNFFSAEPQGPPTAQDYAGVLDEVHLDETKAELAERRAAAPAHQSLEFAGKLSMADDIAHTFQLASEGKLGVRQRKQVPGYFSPGRPLLSFPGMNLAALGKPGKLPRGDQGGPSGHPPAEGGVSGEGGRVEDLRPWRAKRARTAGGGSDVSRESEESLHVTWPSWAEHRHRKYAVIAVDARKVERLMGYWQGRGYPQKDNTKGDAAEAACIVAAAQRKGQGLLLIVQETELDEYEDRREDREERYYERYGKYPYGDSDSDLDEDPDDSDDEYLWQL